MLTKYILTIGEIEHVIPDECLKNWDEIAFSLKRTDYSGVMRSFSTEFVFVGDIKDLLWDLYLTDGFLASASVAVYTITNTHTWVKQYEAALDFSTVEIENDAMSINALDNALASLLKSKKSQKYEYPISDFAITRVNVVRMEIASYAKYNLPKTSNPSGSVNAILNDNSSQVISKEYIEPCNQVADSGYGPINSFFANVHKSGANMTVKLTGVVRCYFCPYTKDSSLTPGDDVPISYLNVMKLIEAEGGGNIRTLQFTAITDELQYQMLHGSKTNFLVNSTKENVFSSLSALQSAAVTRFGTLTSDHNGIFGVVGNERNYNYSSYWQNNDIYEYQNGRWYNKGKAVDYYQDREMSDGIGGYYGAGTVPLPAGNNDAVIYLELTDKIEIQYGVMTINWSDPVRTTLSCRGITPLELITKVVRSITGENTAVTIAEDEAGLIAKTLLIAGEDLRQIYDAKIYTTFGNFCDWMEAVFGYTYRMVGDELQFIHRSAVFENDVVKVIENFRDLKYEVVDDLIYSQVEAGYAKKEYGEIDGRLETNFTNYYTTGYTLTDKKLTLQSKYRADRYGVEFTARKSESETKDDKADEDIFFIRFVQNASTGVNNYNPSYQTAYAPSVCVDNNKAFIAALGNGKAITLTMTSSDGNNGLTNIVIPADTALFTAAELEFTTDDMDLPAELNALVQIDHNGFRFKGFIKEAEARFGRLNGVEYKLIVKEITAL